jgi:hypothetical protein
MDRRCSVRKSGRRGPAALLCRQTARRRTPVIVPFSPKRPVSPTTHGTMNPCYQRRDRNCNCTAIAPKLQSNCRTIAPELQQNPSNCTQLQQNHIGVGGGDLQHEATQPRGTANWCNRLAKTRPRSRAALICSELTRAHIREKSVTEEQRSQPPHPSTALCLGSA